MDSDEDLRLDALLRELNPHWRFEWAQTASDPRLVRRAELDRALRVCGQIPVLAVCGMRRVGKTTLLAQLVRERVRADPAGGRAHLVVNLEDPRLLGQPRDLLLLDRLWARYLAIVGTPARKPLVVLDEVQTVPEWARWVRGMHDRGLADFAVTGSSSALIEPDLATILTGRQITIELWPLSLRERMDWDVLRGAAPHDPLRHAKQATDALMRWGGLPQALLLAETDRSEWLRAQFRDVLHRDIVLRHEVRAANDLEHIGYALLEASGKETSFQRLKARYGLSLDQTRSYAAFVEESYLVASALRFSWKHHDRVDPKHPRKFFAGDLGLRGAVVGRSGRDRPQLAETLVQQALRRRHRGALSFWSGTREFPGECDLVVWGPGDVQECVQVWMGTSGMDLPARELRGLLAAMADTRAPRGTIVTDGWVGADLPKGVRVVPLPEFLLEEDAA